MKRDFHSFVILYTILIVFITLGTFPISVSAFASNDEEVDQDISVNIQKTTEQAKVIHEQDILEKKIALIFEGSASEPVYEKILELLNKYGIKAVFFLPGITIEESPETAWKIMLAGQDIGNCSMNEDKSIGWQPAKQITDALSKAQNTIHSTTELSPDMLCINGSKYSDEMLKAAKALGLDYAIQPSNFLNLGTKFLSSKEQTDYYTEKILWGSIISIRTDSQLNDEIELPIYAPDAPALDPTLTGLNKTGNNNLSLTLNDQENRLIRMVDYLLQSLIEASFDFVTPVELESFADSEFTVDYNALRSDSPVLPDIFSSANTTGKTVALTFNQLGKNHEKLELLIETLEKLNIRATFFVTSNEASGNKQFIEELIQKGHNIENGGFSGKIREDMSYNDICKEIMKGKKYLLREFGIDSKFFRLQPNNSGILVREAAENLGIILTSYDKNPPIIAESTLDEILQYFASGFHRGNILYFSTEEFENMPILMENIARLVRETGYDFTTIADLYRRQYKKLPLEEIEGWTKLK